MLNINNYLKENQGEVVNAVGMAVAIPVAVTNLLEHIPNSKLASQIDLFKASKAYRSLGVCGMMVAAYHSAKSLDHLYSCWEQNIENKQLATDLLTVGSSAFTAINIALPVFFPEARIFQPSLRLAAFVVFDLGGLAAASYEGASSSDLLVNALLTAVFNCGKSDVAELKAGVKQAASFSSSLVHAGHRAFEVTKMLNAPEGFQHLFQSAEVCFREISNFCRHNPVLMMQYGIVAAYLLGVHNEHSVLMMSMMGVPPKPDGLKQKLLSHAAQALRVRVSEHKIDSLIAEANVLPPNELSHVLTVVSTVNYLTAKQVERVFSIANDKLDSFNWMSVVLALLSTHHLPDRDLYSEIWNLADVKLKPASILWFHNILVRRISDEPDWVEIEIAYKMLLETEL